MERHLIQYKIYEVVKTCAKEYWRPYDYIEKIISETLLKSNIYVKSVFCTGEITNLYIYLQHNSDCYVYNKNSDFKHAYLIKEYNISYCPQKDFIILKNINLNLEKLPKIALIALCVLDNFAVPRFNLSTGSIAAYIRLYHKARVFLYDMQLRVTAEEIVSDLEKISPNIVGISITFGQKALSQLIIEKIQSITNLKTLIVVGNIIPSLNKIEYLKLYKNIIVSFGEGEQSFIDLIDFILNKKELSEVRGIAYLDNTGNLKNNGYSYVDMDKLPFPALDTIEKLVKYKGALTIETSRGCNYSKCYFCPREHKGPQWRGLSVDKMVEYFNIIYDISKNFHIPPFIYIADEEFIGQLPHKLELERIIKFCTKVENSEIDVKFDISARVDSIYKPDDTRENNIEKLYMWLHLKKIGLHRLFLGVESGCDEQLVRFNKGTSAIQNKIALQLITALGINIRIGYITFDPLMENLNALRINHKFVEQKDILYTSHDILYSDLSKVYDCIIYNNKFNKISLIQKPLFTKISYPLTSLEVLYHSLYFKNLQIYEKSHNVKLVDNFDINMTRFTTKYANKDIGIISDYCQRWIDHNFSVIYALKGLYKTAIGKSRKYIYNLMENAKTIDHYLLNMIIVQLFNYPDDALNNFLKKENLLMPKFDGSIENKLACTLNYWETLEENKIILEIDNLIKSGKLIDTIDKALSNAISLWYKHKSNWNKIN